MKIYDTLQMKMITVGLDNLVMPSAEALERCRKNNASSHVNTSGDKKWGYGELEFEAEMRALDNAVSNNFMS